MQAREVRTAAQARQLVEASGASHVKIGVFDLDGILRGKYLSREKFFSGLEKGLGFCDVVLGWDSNDQLYDNVKVTGWHTGYPDAHVRILPETCRELPFEPGTYFFLCEFASPADAVCPRGTLRRVIERARGMGLQAFAGLEYEFFVFEETPASVREKHYRKLVPIAPGYFGYSVLRNSVHSELYRGLLALGQQMDFPIEGLHEETGAGVLEAALCVDAAGAAADKAGLFKTFTKVWCQHHGRMATFMAKWSRDWPGQSGHIHLSLRSLDGKSVFHDPKEPHAMSVTMRHFLGGQQRMLPELLAMIAPTVNSYRRLIPGFWAPTVSSWGVENRTCALRFVPGGPSSQRMEVRLAAADANPHLALAASLAAGLHGIEHRLEPDAPVSGNAYAQAVSPELAFAPTLWDAAQRLKQSQMARNWFGDTFVDHFAATREWEEREFRKAITDWELARYFEII